MIVLDLKIVNIYRERGDYLKIENNIPSSIELEQLTKLYRAMGDLTRMKILWFLMEENFV